MSDEARRAAGILAQCKWLRDNISGWEAQAKEVLAKELSGGERTKAVAADGTEIGSVTRAEGARSMQIDNEEGFLVWVKQRYPTEIVETVRPAFIKLCAEKVKMLGGLPDANGELCPHVSMSRAEPKATVQIKDDDRLLIEQMFMHRHMPEVMAAMAPVELQGPIMHADNPIFPPVYTGPLDSPEPIGSPEQVVTPPVHNDPEPYIEEGPPNWLDSNTFEDSQPVRDRRRG